MYREKKIFYTLAGLIIFTNFAFLFYYAHLIPLHVDEAGFWFNWTNKSFLNRLFNENVSLSIYPPFHGLTIYLGKISLPIFGNSGIGLRFPVIFFGISSSVLLYIFTKRIMGRVEIALLAAVLLFLNPFFLHYSHELRGYSSLFFFSLCSYFCLYKLTQSSNHSYHLLLLFLAFFGCYLSNMVSPIFFFVFMVTVFILRAHQRYSSSGRKRSYFGKLTFSKLFIFSFISAAFFSYLLFYFDASYLKVMKSLSTVYQKGQSGSQSANLIAIPDFFSTFLGYKYLDDPESIIYHYPFYLWFCSLIFLLIGCIYSIRKKEFFALFFLVLLVVTSLFYSFSGSHIYTRSGVFLMPFFIIFQASGTVVFIQSILNRLSNKDALQKKQYWILSGLVLFYFLTLHAGKLHNLDAVSGNPFEKTKRYLKFNSGPNDLIISGLEGTSGGFYLGELIRKKTKNIFQNNKISAIYFLTSNEKPSHILLKPYVGSDPKLRYPVIDKNQFSKVEVFENKGVRKSKIAILKTEVSDQAYLNLNSTKLTQLDYFGESFFPCQKKLEKKGIRLSCKESRIACANSFLDIPLFLEKGVFQLGIFNHQDSYAMGRRSIAFLIPKSKNLSSKLFNEKSFLKNYFLLNYLVDYPDILDPFKKNLTVLAPHLQKLDTKNNLVFCMLDKLFDGNSILKAVKFFNIKLKKPL